MINIAVRYGVIGISGVSGPFKRRFDPVAGAAWADWLFMIGLLSMRARTDMVRRFPS